MEEFKLALEKIIRDYFEKSFEKYDSDFMAFGIYTDSDVRTIGIYSNTYSYFEERKKTMTSLFPNIDFNQYKWVMEEWKDELGIHDKDLDFLRKKLFKLGEKELRREYLDYREAILSMFEEILENIKKEDVFKKLNKDFILLIDVSDSHLDEKMLERVLGTDSFREYKKDMLDSLNL
jgi:hypothetical protein